MHSPRERPLLLPCEAGEVAAKPTEGACAAYAPSTTLRAAPLPRFAGEEKRRGEALRGLALLSAALVSTAALASCDRAESRRVAADARDAARQTAAGLDHAAAQAQPVADRAADDAKRGVNDLAIAAGKATRKAGVQLEHAGERAKQGYQPPAPSGSN